MRQVLLQTSEYTVWDDGTFRFHSWEDSAPDSEWRIIDSKIEFKHPGKVNFVVAHDYDVSYSDQWALKIMAILVERELLGE